jgi:RimJ/RimL family protein N-acetyltransferase
MACPAVMDISTEDGVELSPNLDSATLMYAYCRWVGEGLFSRIFPEHPNMTPFEFLTWSTLPAVKTAGCYADGDLVGIGWICQIHQVADKKVAEVGVGFFKGTKLSLWRRGLELLIESAFLDYGCISVYGTSPAPNRAARVLALSTGMRETGRIPLFTQWEGKAVDAIIYSLRRSCYERSQ